MRRGVVALSFVMGCASAPQAPPGPTPTVQALLLAQISNADAQFFAVRADTLLVTKEFERCHEFLSDFALAAHPESPLLRELRALCLWEDNRREDAIADADRAVELDHTRYRAQLLRGNHYFGRDFEAAADAFDAYVQHRPSELAEQDGLPLLKLGLSYLQIDDGPRAERAFEQVTTRFPRAQRWVINANNGLCAAYVKNRKFARAVATCEAIVADPRQIDRSGAAWFNLATAAYNAGHYDRALTAVDEFIRLQPDKPNGPTLRKKIADAMNARPATPQKGARPSQKGGRP